MKVDIQRKAFVLANKTGGVSGPAIHPIAVRMVYEAANAVNVPIIGMGGIATAEDAIEMLLVGASAVSVGTANFYNPAVTMEIVDGIEQIYGSAGICSCDRHGRNRKIIVRKDRTGRAFGSPCFILDQRSSYRNWI